MVLGFLFNLLSGVKHLRYHIAGRCNICNRPSVFICTDVHTARNNMYCLFCRSSSRKRHIAKAIINTIAPGSCSIAGIYENRDLCVYNTDANDAFYKVLKGKKGYTCSVYREDLKMGHLVKAGIYCQNLECLTFGDASFDIVISEDVFEHVRDYKKGFREVYRVLKPGGYHIFSVPCYFDRQTLTRVDTTGDKDILLLPPEYHGDPCRGKIIAYRTYGLDIFNELNALSFKAVIDFSKHADYKNGIVDSYVFITQKTKAN